MTVVSATSVIRSALNNRADTAISALEARTCHSWKMSLDRSGILARPDAFVGHPSFHLYLRDGTGGRVTDLDGNCFIDFSMGFGSLLLGHGVPGVRDAVIEQATQGWHFGLANDSEVVLARHIQAASAANERVMLCNSGCDATAYALRAARAFTGRGLVAVFTGSSHGIVAGGTEHPATGRSERGGLLARSWPSALHRLASSPRKPIDAAVSFAYGREAVFEYLRKRREELAAVIVEPVPAADPSFDHADWLRQLARVCADNGVLLILDERLTGFRLAYGGAQEHFGVLADLVIYGETIGGGLPLGALAGRADILGGLGDDELQTRSMFERGISASALSVAAGAATLEHLATRRSTLYGALEEKSRMLASSFNEHAQALGLPTRMRCAGSIFRIGFERLLDANDRAGGHAAAEAAFYALALSKGVLVHPSRLGFLSAAHSAAEIAQAATAFQSALTEVKSDGLFDKAS